MTMITIFIGFVWLLSIFLLTLLFLGKLTPFRRVVPSGSSNLPPGPNHFSNRGVLSILNGTLHLHLWDLSQKYGPVMLLPFGPISPVLISSKEAAVEGFSQLYALGSQGSSNNFEEIRFAPPGEDSEEWETSRKLALLSLFTTKIQSFRYIREEENDLFVKKLSEYALRQSPVNLTKTLFTLVSSMVCRVMCGQNLRECDFVDEDIIAGLVHKFDYFTGFVDLPDVLPWGGLGRLIDWFFGMGKGLKNAYSELNTFFQNTLDDHLKPGRTVLENPDIIDAMINMIKEQENDEDSFKLTTEYLKEIITDIFLAEVNTSVIALVWVMTELIRNPRVMKKVQDEIRTTLGNKKENITEEDITNLHYFKLVIKETFRLHPSIAFLPFRNTSSQVKIQGYDIPEDAITVISLYAIAHDPKLWTNADEFNPDRFLDSSIDYKGFELLPVHSINKICPEMRMATLELGLVNMLYYFNWGLPKGKTVKDIDLKETGVLTLSKKTTLELVPLLYH